MDRGPQLRLAAWAFAGATLFGSAVSIRNKVPGEPLGIHLPLSIRTALLAGWGAGVAAPWPMPVAALAVTRRSGVTTGTRAGLVCAGIGAVCIAGTLVEPVTRRPRAWTKGIGAAILANVATSVAMIAIGLGSAREAQPHKARSSTAG